MIRGMPDEHGKISREEFLRLTGEEPQRPTDDDFREARETLRKEAHRLAALKKEMRDEMRRSWGSSPSQRRGR